MSTPNSENSCKPINFDLGKTRIENCRVADLARDFGTPLYVISEARLRENVRHYIRAFAAAWDGEVGVMPALKANHALALRYILTAEGVGCDVYSDGELVCRA
ncbi:hypothetical protein [Nocardia sp. NPDC047648]|uniref:hypothetical protein n=1 Tax=Nocardia sp. NPDC047648 TaxID=3155625 RepID=UPI0033ED9A8D